MTIKILRQVLPAETLNPLQQLLTSPTVPWEDGKATAHGAAKDVKNNHQLTKPSEVLRSVQRTINTALSASTAFEKYAMPVRMTDPFINKHAAGEGYGKHVDRGYRIIIPSNNRIRTDISVTIALSDKSEYDGGELVIYDGDSKVSVRMNAGDAVLYPSNFIHEVKAVTRGVRLCACLWLQSMVRDIDKRTVITDTHDTLKKLAEGEIGEVKLLVSKIQQNLIRQWGES